MTNDYHHNAYKAVTYREESKTMQVVMLYEGILRFVRQAREAIEKGDIEARYNSLTKACEIINGLQISLDFKEGGDIAQLLYDYYAGLDQRLSHLHFQQDLALCDVCISHLTMMKEAWEDVHKNTEDKRSSGGSGDDFIRIKLSTLPTDSGMDAAPMYTVLPELSAINVNA